MGWEKEIDREAKMARMDEEEKAIMRRILSGDHGPAPYDGRNRPPGANADQWAIFLEAHEGSRSFIAVQIAEAIKAAETRGRAAAITSPPTP